LIRLALDKYPLPKTADVLHFAPESAVARLLPDNNYRSADMNRGTADLMLDVTAIDLPSRSVDVVVINHVLEHVSDDRRALAELFRILREGGVLIVTIPIIEGWDVTYEDRSVIAPEDRNLHFGQKDHLRYYGRDFRDRVIDAGFSLQEYVASGSDCVRYGLTPGERVFFARR
jgi:SAM-dependent methyltransferase